jgi:hypothetical protein
MRKIALMILIVIGVAGAALAKHNGMAKQGPPDVPEIDAVSLTAGSALVGSVLLMARARRKR